MDLCDTAAYNYEGGLGALQCELSDFARVAAALYLYSAQFYAKDYNTKREKYVLIMFNAMNV